MPTATARRAPDVVFFESWHGQYSDNPRAVAEALHARDAPVQLVFALDDHVEAPPWISRVRPGSLDYLRALGRARCLVVNNTLPGFFRKRRGAFHLQTWHGTPLKRIAFDIASPDFRERNRRYLHDLAREVRGWDALVSPNAFSTDILREAFRFEGDVIETGYPRNDVLSHPDADRIRSETRSRLGLDDEAPAVLYAPTWRDDGRVTRLDLALLARELPQWTVLRRLHALEAQEAAGDPLPSNAIDVSHLADIRELFIAADALITDYSSAMFDFAVTGKPLLFFTYDLERYRDELRGFYFDFVADAPGPLLATSGAVAAALGDLDSVAAAHADAYRAFRERFCHLDDGRAGARVADVLLDGETR